MSHYSSSREFDEREARTQQTLSLQDGPEFAEKASLEYILVADKTSLVLKSTTDYKEIVTLAAFVRKAGGEVTIFRALKA